MDSSVSFGSDFTLIGSLNEHERQILGFFAEHYSNQEIADTLFLSLNTVKWYARQIYGKLGVSNRREAVLRAQQLGLLSTPAATDSHLPHNLPAHLTEFVGRQSELAALYDMLLNPGCRLLTITGPGGIGKTRLALTVADRLVQEAPPAFKDGVFLASLADLEDVDAMGAVVANAVGYRFSQTDVAPGQQLGQFLGRKHLLMVLDNFEHLLNEASLRFLVDTLTAAPGVKMLVTSRVRLNIRGEQGFPIFGLAVPQQITPPGKAGEDADSVKLFADAAHRANPAFALDATIRSSVVDICRLVDGMPLAIELAAAWTTALAPAQILKEIHGNLDFLASDAADVPVRHRSLPAVFDASWQLLDETERAAMQSLSVFRGGFTSDAARAITGAGSSDITGLASQELVAARRRGALFQYTSCCNNMLPKIWRKMKSRSTVHTHATACIFASGWPSVKQTCMETTMLPA